MTRIRILAHFRRPDVVHARRRPAASARCSTGTMTQLNASATNCVVGGWWRKRGWDVFFFRVGHARGLLW